MPNQRDPLARTAELTREQKVRSTAPNHALYLLISLGLAVLWTGVGCGVALAQKGVRQFLEEWYLLQGFFLIALGTWLILVVRSGTLAMRASAATRDGNIRLTGLGSRRLRFAIAAFIGVFGTASVINMGFHAHGTLLAFMWITCACVCLTAAVVTLHAIDIVVVVHGLQDLEVKAFRYAPARTPELRDFVTYFTSFTLLMTIGYALALAATLYAHWTGSTGYVAAVRIFWPVLYVPACSIVMIYPHVVVHRLIQREKDRTLFLCQQEMDQLLVRYPSLNSGEIERTNSLAQMFDRISATPNYVLDLGIAMRTILPFAFNLATLFLKPLVNRG